MMFSSSSSLCGPQEAALPSHVSWKSFRHGWTSFLAIITVFMALWEAVLEGRTAEE